MVSFLAQINISASIVQFVFVQASQMIMKTTMVVVVVIAIMFTISSCVEAISGQHGVGVAPKNVSCILVFGDSSVDPGNNNRLNTTFKANFAPYGKNFFNGQFTGRFSNGRLPTDFIAESLGLKMSIPAFLDPTLKKDELLTGVSFASAASGYDNFTAKITKVLPVAKQLEYFKHYKVQLKRLVGKEKSSEILKNTLFLLSTGTNDFMQNYFLDPTRPKQFTVDQYTTYLTICMTQDIKELHRMGATRLVVVGLPPIGCMPIAKTLTGSAECVHSFNTAASLLNAKIKSTLVMLRTSLRMSIGYEDIYTIFEKAIKYPLRNGLVETKKGCCGSGTIELGLTCKGQSTCKEPSKYMFWDSVHPTENVQDHIR